MKPAPLTIRPARREDVPVIVALLADDHLGAEREQVTDPLPQAYWEAFDALDTDERHLLVVGEQAGQVVATLQLSFLPSLSHRGGERAEIEAVRVRSDRRGSGAGEQLVRWAVDQARARRCRLVQLTSDRSRVDAHRFYERLGFTASHVGMKLHLP